MTAKNYKWSGWESEELDAKYEEQQRKKKYKKAVPIEEIAFFQSKNKSLLNDAEKRPIQNIHKADIADNENLFGRIVKEPLTEFEKRPLEGLDDDQINDFFRNHNW